MKRLPVNTRSIVVAFAILYIVWGSTYLTIKFAIETIPPLIMISGRFLFAGLAMYAVLIASGAKHPPAKHWLWATVLGSLLLAGGTGSVVMAEQSVPTGMVSLLVAMVPVYMVLFEHFGKSFPGKRKVLGLLLGTIGIITLIGPANLINHKLTNIVGILTVLIGSVCWSSGSMLARTAPKPESTLLSTAMQMICGGIVLGIAAVLAGEHTHFILQAVTMKSWLSLIYLIVVGSIVGFTAYIWLLEHVSPSKVSTYAYVNPIIAVFLGCAFAGESFTPQTAVAATVILSAVWLITSGSASTTAVKPQELEPASTNESRQRSEPVLVTAEAQAK